jgi:hypothetical protein
MKLENILMSAGFAVVTASGVYTLINIMDLQKQEMTLREANPEKKDWLLTDGDIYATYAAGAVATFVGAVGLWHHLIKHKS